MTSRPSSRTKLACGLLLVFGACSKSPPQKVLECDQGWLCQDSDCDTLCDDTEGADERDTDRDGTPDYLDLDSDGDTISDLEEAGDDDPATPPADRNRDGIADYLDKHYPLGAGKRRDGGGELDAMVTPSDAAVVDAGPPPADSAAAIGCVSARPSGCGDREADSCNGLDEDCDGKIDEGSFCECKRGEVRRCFPGPPGRRGVGACEDGHQVCVGDEFSQWGPCESYRAPERELCDSLDNDCNGCSDELEDCQSKLSCPGPLDPRTPDAKPFIPYELDGARFYQGGDALTYTWYVRGSPCDRMFETLDPSATPESGKLSFTLQRATQQRAEALFTLSGSYEIVLRITTRTGDLWCGFIVHVRAPGLRVELCWDKTGPSAHALNQAVDLDLHLAKANRTNAFFTADDCYWESCRGAETPWEYANTTPIDRCSGAGAQNQAVYALLGYCPNPRLDADNRLDARSASRYVTENISLDSPQLGDQFRVMVHYATNSAADAQDEDAGVPAAIATNPLVNVYCDGELRGSFGGAPVVQGEREELGLSSPGQMWRVADIVSASGTCDVKPLTPPSGAAGYWVSGYEPSYGN